MAISVSGVPRPEKEPVPWNVCTTGRCLGIQLPSSGQCLAHAPADARDEFFAACQPGMKVDLRGVPLDQSLVTRLMDCVYEPASNMNVFDSVDFSKARFDQSVDMRHVAARGADFKQTTFGHIDLSGCEFGSVDFQSATFDGGLSFSSIACGIASFHSAVFNGDIDLSNSTFEGAIDFSNARFIGVLSPQGPIYAGDHGVELNGAQFEHHLVLNVATTSLMLRGAYFKRGAIIHVSHANIYLDGLSGDRTVTVRGSKQQVPLTAEGPKTQWLQKLVEAPITPRVQSLSGVDGSRLILEHLDARNCCLVDAANLDQLQLGDSVQFERTSSGLLQVPRPVVADEVRWRSHEEGAPTSRQLATVYRRLRKSFEDNKNEPEAGNFYYSEMEMRRAAATLPSVERFVLGAYRALSGYGLVASRSLLLLLGLIAFSSAATTIWGLPTARTPQAMTGTISPQPSGVQRIDVTSDTESMSVRGPVSSRFTLERVEASSRTTLSAVVFRDSGESLTTVGKWIQMFSKFFGAFLLALSLLAIRARVKR